MKPTRFLALLLPLALLAACDSGGGGSSDNDAPPTFAITTSALGDALADTPYSAQLNTANGAAPVTFAWAAGFTPPAWLSLSAAGELSGTPTAPASLALQIQATDSGMTPAVAQRSLNLEVLAAPSITTASLPRGIKGQGYNQQLSHDGTGALPLTFVLATGSALPAGMNLSAAGVLTGSPADGGLFVLEIELRYGSHVVDTSSFDLVVYESIPYTYIEDSLEPNDGTGTSTQLLPGATPAGRLTAGNPAVQATPLTLNSDLNITKPDGDDFFKFNIGTPGTITVEVFFRGLVGEVDVYLWKYAGAPTHAVTVVAQSEGYQSDDEKIVYYGAGLSGSFSIGYYYLQVHAPADAASSLWNRNAYSFRVSFNDLSIDTAQLEADSASGPVNVQVSGSYQGGALTSPQWSLVNGNLPTGVSFTSDGRFTGTPSEFGLREYTVRLEDSGASIERDIKVRFFDSSAGDYWQVRGERRLYDTGAGHPLLEAWGDAMVVAPHPDYPAEGAIYVLGGFSSQMLDSVRVFHTDRAGIPADKQFKFEDINKPLPNSLRYHGAAFVQHSYGGYIYVVGGEIGAAGGVHTVGDLWRGVYRLQVSDGGGAALGHPLTSSWELLAGLPDTAPGGEDIKGWGEFGLAAFDQAADADDRIYLLGGRYDLEDAVGSATYSRKFHDEVLMFECPTGAAGSGAWFWKSDAAPYTPRRFPAVGVLNGRIYMLAGREGAVGQTGSGGVIADYIEMYQPDPYQANAALAGAGKTQFPVLTGSGGYYPMFATLNGSIYVWCGWDSSFAGTRTLHKFTPNGGGVGGTATRLMDADWSTGFGGGVAHDGKLWIISGIGHGAEDEPRNLVYFP
ncbi:MAG: putative Ig domain-containing protein [Planctomycetota bacterium]|nr:putative Ig domain-containing protein [Planctomycetota bacterium]